MAAPTYATTIEIQVLSVTHTATVTVARFPDLTRQTETATDAVPVAVSLSQTYCNDYFCGAYAVANASADLLEISATAYAGYARAWASVDSALTFAPLSDGLAEIGVVGVAGIVASTHSVTLFDITANQQLWAFAGQRGSFIDQTMLTPLSAAHVYAVHLTATAEGSNDSSNSTLRLSGLRAVPDEGGTLMYLGLGVVVLLLTHRTVPACRPH